MRNAHLIVLFLFAASGLCLASPQDNTPAPNTEVTPNWSQRLKEKVEAPRKPRQMRVFPLPQRFLSPGRQYDCFHIHSFNFEKGGGESPRLESETTCTPNTVRVVPAQIQPKK